MEYRKTEFKSPAHLNKNISTATILFCLNTAKINAKIMLFVNIYKILQTFNAFKLLEFGISLSICIKKVVIPNVYIILHNSTNR